MVMLQRLPPQQRAVLILRDVLGFSAADAAAHLGVSVAAVNSALQRARATARADQPGHSQQAVLRSLGEGRVARLAHQYADAIEAGDVETLLDMLTEDATWLMPPVPNWFTGHDALRAWLVKDPLPLRWRHHPTTVNGQLAVGGYLFDQDAGDFVPHVIDVLTLSPYGKIAAVTAFLLTGRPGTRGVLRRVRPPGPRAAAVARTPPTSAARAA